MTPVVRNSARNRTDCRKYREKSEYSISRILANNIPYALMTLLGGIIFLLVLGFNFMGFAFMLLYIIYGIAGSLWIIVFMCPHCHYHGTNLCPCGYGAVSARLMAKGKVADFNRKFRRHIPVIVPLWIIPLLVGAYSLAQDFTLPMLLLLIVFAIDSFIILPLISRSYGCAHCPQKENCPWMR